MDPVCTCTVGLDAHCETESCSWWVCPSCQLVIGQQRAIPTWKRYLVEERHRKS